MELPLDPDYDELYVWSMGRPGFILQHVVCARHAQTADETMKPVTLDFALAGLYLHLERGWDGTAVQRAHKRMADASHDWPRLPLPADRGAMTAADVLAAPESERAERIDALCAEVWAAYAEVQEAVRALVAERLPAGFRAS